MIDRARDELTKFVAIDSVSAQRRNQDKAATFISELLKAEGFSVKSYPGISGGPILIAESNPEMSDEGTKTLLIYNHYDVQPETPLDLWNSPPFEMTERDGYWYGRGTADDKGEIIARLTAIRLLKSQNGGRLPFKIKWLLEGEEEIGSPSLDQFVAEHKDELKADGCLWESGEVDAEGRPILYAGLKGISTLELRCRVAETDLHSQLGAVVDNPIYRLAKAITLLRDDNGRILIPGYYDDVRPPTQTELKAVHSIPDESAKVRDTYGLKRYLGPTGGKEYYEQLIFEPAININGLHSGYGDPGSKTVLPAYAFAKIDLRLVPDQTPEKAAELLRKHLINSGFDDIEVIQLDSREGPARSDLNQPFVQMAVQSAREVYGVEPVLYPNMAGSGPMHPFVKELNIPVVGFGISYYASRIHAPNENIRIKDFEQGIEQLINFFNKFKAS